MGFRKALVFGFSVIVFRVVFFVSTQKFQYFHRFLQHIFLNVGSQTEMFVASRFF